MDLGWDQDNSTNSTHIFPVGDSIEHVFTNDCSCICGIKRIQVKTPSGGHVWVNVHTAKDGRPE